MITDTTSPRLVLSATCERGCPGPLDPAEAFGKRFAEATAKLGLAHIVVTSPVDRDDLADGGADHFARTIRAIRDRCRQTTIEVLTPDFLRKDGALETVIEAKPDVFNHNLDERCRRNTSLSARVRAISRRCVCCSGPRKIDPTIFTKSGIMVGLGEERNEILQVMDDMRAANVEFLTVGQYLQPTRKHHEVMRFVPPDEFKSLETIAATPRDS